MWCFGTFEWELIIVIVVLVGFCASTNLFPLPPPKIEWKLQLTGFVYPFSAASIHVLLPLASCCANRSFSEPRLAVLRVFRLSKKQPIHLRCDEPKISMMSHPMAYFISPHLNIAHPCCMFRQMPLRVHF